VLINLEAVPQLPGANTDAVTRIDEAAINNLSILIAGSHERLASIMRKVPAPRTRPTWRDITRSLEEQLILLLSLPTSSNLDYTVITQHADRYRRIAERPNWLPPNDYSETLLLTDRRVWGTSASSIGYYLLLGGYRMHYASPCRLVYEATRTLWSMQPNWKEYYATLGVEELLDSHRFFKAFLSQPTGITRVAGFLNAIQNIEAPYLERYWVVPGGPDLLWDLWHGQIDPALFNLYEDLSQDPPDELREWLIPTEPGLLRQVSSSIITSLPYPGGLNTHLVAMAAHMTNLAYIHAYNSPRPDVEVYVLADDAERTRLGRVRNLLYTASQYLRRSTLDHWVIMGNNLAAISEIDNQRGAIQDLDL